MKGDFSEWEFDSQSNEIGVLHQQGRGLLDQDWNLAAAIAASQRQVQARDAIGPFVAAVPAELKNSFKVTQAEADANGVDITLNPGRIWINGSVIQLREWPSLPQPATYLEPPFHTAIVDTSSIANGVRDAVILEVWPEALNAFQNPVEMLEPALGGVDTTERAKLYHRLRLLRLEAGDDCSNIADKLADDFSSKGKLSVGANEIILAGDCPLETGGGYAGFEHYLIRIELAEPDAGLARFKWSRFNGGLVGRGVKSATEDKVDISANDQMINHCGLTSFYLEALLENPVTGIWEISFSADATLSADGELDLTNMTGSWPDGDGSEAFFRLWDGIDTIGNFPINANPTELAFGLHLQFEAPDAGNTNYMAGDFWTFPVRAAGAVGFDADEAWPTDSPPQGVRTERVPLAILNWGGPQPTTISAPDQIHDCRHVFQPLTQLDSCCSYSVGNGTASHGDFDSIQDAIDALPSDGGEICVLAGTYTENVVVKRDNVHIHGCGDRTRVISGPPDEEFATADPVFTIPGRHHVRISNLAVQADPTGIGVLVDLDEQRVVAHHIALDKLLLEAASESAIFVRAGNHIAIHDCRINMADVRSEWPGLFLRADDALIEHNRILVVPGPDPAGAILATAGTGRGGIQIAGTSERVRVIDNYIQGGIGNGITLGTLKEVVEGRETDRRDLGWVVNRKDPCDPCGPGDVYIPPGRGDDDDPRFESEGSLYDLRIERNRILDMGMNGIGVVAFFNLDAEDEFISVVKLQILGNSITGCLYREIADNPEEVRDFLGYGGVSLADVEEVQIFDNIIEDNGFNHIYPVCGIFCLHGEGLDICRNRIVNNGAKTADKAENANPGQRAGIRIIYALPGIVPLSVSEEIRPRQNGVPAIRIHDNIVSQPLGQALYLGALGPVTIEGNQLTSRGIVPDFTQFSAWASTVAIVNYGLSNEFYLQYILFTGATADPLDVGDTPSASDEFISAPRKGIDDAGFGRYMANGNVLFSGNQVVTDLLEEDLSFAISSTLIITLDDIQVTDNQFDCNFLIDFLFTNLLAVGMTVRINNNRLKETMLISLFSSVALGLIFNNCSNNQTTHCILNMDSPLNALPWLNTEIRAQGNQVLFSSLSFFEGWCERFSKMGGLLSG